MTEKSLGSVIPEVLESVNPRGPRLLKTTAPVARDLESERAAERQAYLGAIEGGKEAHYRACGVGTRMTEKLLSGLDETPAVLATREFVKGPWTFLLLYGAVGCGKTLAACEMFWLIKNPVGGYESIGYVEEPYRSGGLLVDAHELAALPYWVRKDERRLDQASRKRLLVLDDLGLEPMTDGWRSNLLALVKHREAERLKTIITTNRTLEELRDRPYDAPVLNRIRGSGVFKFCGDKSLRGEP